MQKPIMKFYICQSNLLVDYSGTDYSSIAPEFISCYFCGVCVAQSLVCCAVFCSSLFVLLSFFSHSIVCPSLIYYFWLPLWYLQTFYTVLIQPLLYYHLPGNSFVWIYGKDKRRIWWQRSNRIRSRIRVGGNCCCITRYEFSTLKCSLHNEQFWSSSPRPVKLCLGPVNFLIFYIGIYE